VYFPLVFSPHVLIYNIDYSIFCKYADRTIKSFSWIILQFYGKLNKNEFQATRRLEAILFKVLIIGLGNLLMSDDGLGVIAVNEIHRRHKEYDEVCFLDVGTSVLKYVTDMGKAETLIAIDAITAGYPPGTIYCIEEKEMHLLGNMDFFLNSHGCSLSEVVALSRELTGFPSRVIIYGIEPHTCEVGFFISAQVRKSLKKLIDIVSKKLIQLCRQNNV